jgi:hypothetical protein
MIIHLQKYDKPYAREYIRDCPLKFAKNGRFFLRVEKFFCTRTKSFFIAMQKFFLRDENLFSP